MTRKELQEIVKSYRRLAISCLNSELPYQQIVGICEAIATEMCYNHHEGGQRIWAFFKAIEEVSDHAEEE